MTSLAFEVTERDQAGHSFHGVAVFLARGSMLSGVYIRGPDPQPAPAMATTHQQMVALFAIGRQG